MSNEEDTTLPEGNSADSVDESAFDDSNPLEGIIEPEVEASEELVVDDPIELLQTEVGKWKDLALRNQAELENFRKRTAREKQDALKFGNSSLLTSLLPIIDNFGFGLQAAQQEAEGSILLQGMEMVHKQMTDFLENEGCKEINALGEKFDPNIHDAVKEEYSADTEEGVILSVIRRGFKLNDRLLRAANVVVSKGPESAEGDAVAEPEEAAAS